MTMSSTKKSPWQVDVDVHLKSDDEPPKFRIGSYLQDRPGGKLVFDNRGRPGFTIIFHLFDETNSGYRFPGPPDLDEAVWSQLGPDKCPESKIAQVFDPVRVINNGMSLVVSNRNPKPAQGEFTYTLRVTNGSKWKEIDPGGINQNGHD